MKRLAMVLAVGALLFSLFSIAGSAHAALSFEDPQICLNGKLLMVEPTSAPIEVWLRVGPDVQVDFNIVNCGGDPNLPTVDPTHVRYNGKSNWVEVAVKTRRWSDVLFHWNGSTYTRNSGNDNWIYVRARVN